MNSPPLSWELPYDSRRAPVFASNAVATSHPLAVSAGVSMYGLGGNAVDAAIASAAALVAVEPTNNGLGSDAFAIVSAPGQAPIGLNSSGRSPAGLEVDRLLKAGSVGPFGWDSVTVPGAVAGWAALSERYGRLPFPKLLEPAIRYAENGVPAAPRVAREWEMMAALFAEQPDFARDFLFDGSAPSIGRRFRIDGLARSLRLVAETNGRSLYSGELAERFLEHSHNTGGCFAAADLASHAAQWVEPMRMDYGRYSLLELPPNGQGIAALVALGILGRLELPDGGPDGAQEMHLQIEAMKAGVEAAQAYVGDPDAMNVEPQFLVSDAFLDDAAARIDCDRALPPALSPSPFGDTVYLSTADSDGMFVSYIQSNYFSFGSGIVVPGTGISLQNRGAGFCAEPGHPNCVAAKRRPFQTIIPALALYDGEPLMSFGVMGGPMQPQGHLQLFMRVARHGQNPQAAIDAPRWQTKGGVKLALEQGMTPSTVSALQAKGHECREEDPYGFGGAQAIYRLTDGYVAASDPRKDGHAAGW